jgi:hypothetical protein
VTHRRRADRGSGILSTTFGIGVFLVLLMSAAHVLLNLWIISSVDAVAYDAAVDTATSGASDDQVPLATQRALERARAALGDYGSEVDMSFLEVSDTQVVLLVRAPQLSLFPPGLARFFDPDGVRRTIVVAREPTES